MTTENSEDDFKVGYKRPPSGRNDYSAVDLACS